MDRLSEGESPGGGVAERETDDAPLVGAEQVWTPEQEAKIRVMVDQIRRLQDLSRRDGGWWHRRRRRRAKHRLFDLMQASGPELWRESELRRWKSTAMVELCLDFACSEMTRADTAKAVARIEVLNDATYEDLQKAKRALADRNAAGR